MATRTPASDDLTPKFMTAVITAIVVSGLYFGRPVLMPLALAVVMSFAIAPLVEILRHLRLGHAPAVLLSLALALVILSAVGTFVGAQFAGPALIEERESTCVVGPDAVVSVDAMRNLVVELR